MRNSQDVINTLILEGYLRRRPAARSDEKKRDEPESVSLGSPHQQDSASAVRESKTPDEAKENKNEEIIETHTPIQFLTGQANSPRTHGVLHKFLLDQGILNIVVENNVTKNTEIHFVTNPQVILDLQKYGVTRSQADTSRVIEAVGQYRLWTAKRRIHGNIESNKIAAKLFTVDQFNEQIKALQGIERCIHSNGANVSESFDVYIKFLRGKIAEIDQMKEAGLVQLERYYPDARQALRENYQRLLDRANAFAAQKNLDPNSHALQYFLRTQIGDNISDLDELNKQMTWNASDSILRGKLHNFIRDAEVVNRDYVFDPKKPILREHQLDFTEDGRQEIIYKSSQHIGSDRESLEKALYAISDVALTGDHKENPNPTPTRSPAWRNFTMKRKQTLGQAIKNLFYMLICFVVNALLLSPFNFIEKVILGNRGVIHHMMDKIEKYFFPDGPGVDLRFSTFKRYIGVNKARFSTLLGNMIHSIFVEVFYFLKESIVRLKDSVLFLLKDIKRDFKSGYGALYRWLFSGKATAQDPTKVHSIPSVKNIATPKGNAVPLLTRTFTQWKSEAIQHNPEITAYLHQAFPEGQAEQAWYATPLKPLKPYAPRDPLSEITRGVKAFVNLFKDEVFNKHPVTALMCSLAYVVCGSAVIMPSLMKFVATHVGFSVQQAYDAIVTLNKVSQAMSAGAFGGAISVGFTAAKLTGLVMNGVMGTESWMMRIADYLQNDFVMIVLTAGGAYALGFAISEISPIKHVIDEELGSIRIIGQTFLGGKVAVVLMEASASSEESRSFLSEFFRAILHFASVLIRCVLSPLTGSVRPWSELWQRYIKQGIGSFFYIVNELVVLTFQGVGAILYAISEATTTLFIFGIKALTLPWYLYKGAGSIHLSFLIRFQHDVYQLIDHYITRPFRELSRWLMQAIGRWMTEETNFIDEALLDYCPSRTVNLFRESSIQGKSDLYTVIPPSYRDEAEAMKEAFKNSNKNHEPPSNLALN